VFGDVIWGLGSDRVRFRRHYCFGRHYYSYARRGRGAREAKSRRVAYGISLARGVTGLTFWPWIASTPTREAFTDRGSWRIA
jgi:hypothetical protein